MIVFTLGTRGKQLFTYDGAKIKKMGLVVPAVPVHVCSPSIRKVDTERPGFEARFSYIKNLKKSFRASKMAQQVKALAYKHDLNWT